MQNQYSIIRTVKTKKLPLGSICVPVFNEEENLQGVYNQFCMLADAYRGSLSFELIFTDNGSKDKSWEIIKGLAMRDSRVRGIRFGRNVGYQKSILFNLGNARGSFAIQMDADLQEPIEVVYEFIALWQQGYKVVSGRRIRRSEGRAINFLRHAGYKILESSSGGILKPDIGDFRLLDREVVELLAQSKNPTPYLRGMISSLGFNESFVDYHRKPRIAGKSKFPLPQILSLGWNGLLSFSKWPLVFVNFAIFVALALSMLLIGFVVVSFISSVNLSTEFILLIMTGSLALLFSTIVSAIALFYIKAIYEVVIEAEFVYTIDHNGASMRKIHLK